MKKVLLNVLIAMIMILGITCVVIAEVPNTFSPGTTAKSSEVNANFQYVNYGNIVVKANGVEIGTYIGKNFLRDHDVVGIAQGLGTDCFEVLNPNGYIIPIEIDKIAWHLTVYYTGTNCDGSSYVSASTFLPGSVVFVHNTVGEIQRIGQLFYISKNAIPVTIRTYSWFNPDQGNTCKWTPLESNTVYQLLPNNPAVTGVSSDTFATPITIERR